MQQLDSESLDRRLGPVEDRFHSRRVIGLHVSSRVEWMSAAAVSCEGRGLDASLRITGMQKVRIPSEITADFKRIHTSQAGDPARISVVQAELAECQAALVHQLISESHFETDQVLVTAVNEPGIWHQGRHGDLHWLGLCDAARLAEGTGLSVVDAFPSRDLAQGGRGGPLSPIPMLMILGTRMPSPESAWVVVELSRAPHVTYFSSSDSAAESRISSHSVQPGLDLLDELVQRMSSGRQFVDSSGHLAVQGRRIPGLFNAWTSLSEFLDPGEWAPNSLSAEKFLDAARENSEYARCALQDILCTASHLVIEGITRTIKEHLPQDPAPTTAVVIGGGCKNGFLMSEIAGRFPADLRLCQTSDLGLDHEALKPAMAAALGILYVDHVPANLPAISGAQTPRILGRLTPGNPRHWRRLLEEMAANRPQTMTLRHAI